MRALATFCVLLIAPACALLPESPIGAPVQNVAYDADCEKPIVVRKRAPSTKTCTDTGSQVNRRPASRTDDWENDPFSP